MTLAAVGDRLLGLRLLRLGVALGVDDGEVVAFGQPGVLEELREEPAVVGFPQRSDDSRVSGRSTQMLPPPDPPPSSSPPQPAAASASMRTAPSMRRPKSAPFLGRASNLLNVIASLAWELCLRGRAPAARCWGQPRVPRNLCQPAAAAPSSGSARYRQRRRRRHRRAHPDPSVTELLGVGLVVAAVAVHRR